MNNSNHSNNGTIPFSSSKLILPSLIIVYVSLVAICLYVTWSIGTYLSVLAGNKWVKYLILIVVTPFVLAYLMLPTGYVFDVIYDSTPGWLWNRVD